MTSDGSVLVDAGTFARGARQQGYQVTTADVERLFRKMGFTIHVTKVSGRVSRLWRSPKLVEARKIFEAVYGIKVAWPETAKGWEIR